MLKSWLKDNENMKLSSIRYLSQPHSTALIKSTHYKRKFKYSHKKRFEIILKIKTRLRARISVTLAVKVRSIPHSSNQQFSNKNGGVKKYSSYVFGDFLCNNINKQTRKCLVFQIVFQHCADFDLLIFFFGARSQVLAEIDLLNNIDA